MKKNSFFNRKFNFKTPSAFTLVEISVVIIIVGILLAGISQVFEMISEASLRSARTLSKASRITRTDDLALWLDATSDKAFDKEKDDNTTVSIWKDTNPKSTSTVSSSTSLASLYPSYILSAISSLPAVRFKKTNASVGNCITIPSQSFVNNSEDFTLYLTYSPITLDDGVIIEKNNATATTSPFSLELNSGFYKFSVKDSSNTISVIGARQAKINTPNLIRLSRTKGSQIEISINGVSSSQSDTLTSSTFNDAELAIGCRNGATPANFINGDVGEVSFFNRNLSAKEKTDIEEYLYKKWKMKKNEGALATQEFIACSVPSNINADSAVTTVQPTASAQIACATGFNGSINYKCNSGVFTVLSNTCSIIKCSVPNNLNTTADGTQVSYTSSPLPLTCKSGYNGGINYTCDSNGFLTNGACSYTPGSCSLSGTISAQYQVRENVNLNICTTKSVNLVIAPADAETVIESSTWKIKNLSNYSNPYFTIRYNCSLINNAYTLRIEMRMGCYYPPTYYGNCYSINGTYLKCLHLYGWPADSNCNLTGNVTCEYNWTLN